MQAIEISESNKPKEIFLGRQPILNGKRQTIGYELLFRSKSAQHRAFFDDDLTATATVIVNMLSQFGIGRVLGNKNGFLNVSTSLLMSETIELLPPERVVLELLEDVPINSQILARCHALKSKGFMLAIDGYENRSEFAPLLPHIDFVKIDMSQYSIEQAKELIKSIRKVSSAKIIAEKVEDEALFLKSSEIGFDAYQGFFFAKPTIIRGKKAQPHQMSLMRIMGLLLGDSDLDQLEPIFKNNPSLTIGLLKLVNSVGVCGAFQKVESIRQAIVVLGQRQLMRWVQLLLYSSSDSQSSMTLMAQVANRARMMELTAKQMNSIRPNFSDQAFMVGMLSLADVMMQTTMEEILNEIGLSEEMQGAIAHHQGDLGKLLQLAKLIEVSDFEDAKSVVEELGLASTDLLAIQLESLEWSTEIVKQAA